MLRWRDVSIKNYAKEEGALLLLHIFISSWRKNPNDENQTFPRGRRIVHGPRDNNRVPWVHHLLGAPRPCRRLSRAACSGCHSTQALAVPNLAVLAFAAGGRSLADYVTELMS